MGTVVDQGVGRHGQSFETPNPTPDPAGRATFLGEAVTSFVSPSQANKQYYRVILECLWPSGHGVPGPIVRQADVRTAIDDYRASNGHGAYRDPFRRMRELQGEEGFYGIVKVGASYQLVDTTIGDKRSPREGLNDTDWAAVLERTNGRCAVCGREQGTMLFEPDHKVPRLRGGGDEVANFQALCTECNNTKSTQCRRCDVECEDCTWAFPEVHPMIRIRPEHRTALAIIAEREGRSASEVLNDRLSEVLSEARANVLCNDSTDTDGPS